MLRIKVVYLILLYEIEKNMLDKIIELIKAGGPMMYPMTVVGFFIFALGIYQIIWLLIWSVSAKRYSCGGAPMWAEKALEMAKSKKGINGVSLMESIDICICRAESCMLKKMPDIRFLSQISTLMGFLGTVTGMVKVFDTVAKMGMVTPGDLAGGIHEALFTTVYGLSLALCGWVFSHIIERLANKHIRQLEFQVFKELEESDLKAE